MNVQPKRTSAGHNVFLFKRAWPWSCSEVARFAHWREVSCARRRNFAKSAAIFGKHDEAKFSMSVASRVSGRR
jgi:hypothetical protein